ncbi:MAG: D-glycero-alpha-D-manno-heptose-1,7-bisphosphate 7-phosphatase [Candidatus Helarchaeota archaeon]
MAEMKDKKKAIFLDRDGTLIEDKGYSFKIEDCKLLPGVIKGLQALQTNYLFFIITNQSGIERGFYTSEDFHRYNNYLIKQLKAYDITIERTYFCPHIGGCSCKKPNTKFIEMIRSEFKIDIGASWVIGDHPSDVMMGLNAGCQTIYLLTGHGTKHFKELQTRKICPSFIAPDFRSAAYYILRRKRGKLSRY